MKTNNSPLAPTIWGFMGKSAKRIKVKYFFILLLFNIVLFSAEFSKELPMESNQIIESFDCFSKDDKALIKAYLLALKYRIDNVDKRNLLVKSELDYWRLLNIVNNISSKCILSYDFDNILEETLIQNEEDKKRLKKLRIVEGSIYVDGESEFSERMRKYDEKLRKKILQNPIKYKILPKNKNMHDYNLNTIKDYPPNTIPKNIYMQIKSMKLNSLQKNTLMREAYLKEEMLRSYDNPKKRLKLKQELNYIQKCIDNFNKYANGEFYHNFKRKLAHKSIVSASYYKLKNEFIPKEIESYCEHNITKMDLKPFTPKKDKLISKKKKKKIELINLKNFFKRYKNSPKKRDYANNYLKILKKELSKNSNSNISIEALELIRLKDCLISAKKDKKEFIVAITKDIKKENLKEQFYNNIIKPQEWWYLTIGLKEKTEGSSKELKEFFKCSKIYDKSQLGIIDKPIKKVSKEQLKRIEKNNKIKFKVTKAQIEKRELLKYYCGVFYGKTTKDLNNKKAIEAGMVPKKYILKNSIIKPFIAKKLIIKGMPKGGMKLIYKGVPKGLACEGMLEFLNMDETIFFNNKSYEGLDYVMINKTKIMMQNFSMQYAKSLCNQKELNDISYVIENAPTLQEYGKNVKEAVSLYNRAKKKKIVSIKPLKGFVKIINKELVSPYFLILSNKSYIVNKDMELSKIITLPKQFNYALNGVISKDANLIYSRDYIYYKATKDIQDFKKFGKYKGELFLNNNKILLVSSRKKLFFINIKNKNIIKTLQPNFVEPNKKYFTSEIKKVISTNDSKELYILSTRGEVEYWRVKKRENTLFYKFVKRLNINDELINSIDLNPYNQKQLICSTNKNKIYILNRKNYKIEKELSLDRRTFLVGVDIDSKQKRLLAYDNNYVYIFDLQSEKLIDVIGTKDIDLYGAMFQKNSNDIIYITRRVTIWSLLY